MKWLLIFLLLSPASAWAQCIVTIPAGALEAVYCNAESVTFASPYAMLSDTVAGQLGTWAQNYFKVPANQAFAAWFDNVMTNTAAQMQQSLTVQAPVPVITPAQ